MNALLLSLLVLVNIPIAAMSASAQGIASFPSATELTAVIVGSVQLSGSEGILKYHYKIENRPESHQALALWALQYEGALHVRITETPSDWLGNASIGGQPQAGWVALSLLRPGSSQSGFEVESEGLPGIVDASVRGFIPFEDRPTFPEGQVPEDVPGSGIADNSLTIKTIGPVPAPAIFNALDFLNHLIALKEEAFQLGWISNRGILTSLDAKLNAAQKKLNAGKVQAARRKLEAFLRKLEAQNGKHISSEAYGLLKSNGVYLLSQLPPGDRSPEDDAERDDDRDDGEK